MTRHMGKQMRVFSTMLLQQPGSFSFEVEEIVPVSAKTLTDNKIDRFSLKYNLFEI